MFLLRLKREPAITGLKLIEIYIVMIQKYFFIYILIITGLFSCKKLEIKAPVELSGELRQWHNIVMIIEGPEAGENDSINPFLYYRLNVTFWKKDKKYVIPGYFAGDGNAAESGTDSGNKWKVNFCPDDYGVWNYKVSFRSGLNISVNDDAESGTVISPNGYASQLTILPTDRSGQDLMMKGRLAYIGEPYLQYSGNREFFIKAGADSPENFLGYQDFDGTYFGGWNNASRDGEAIPNRNLHKYSPHIQDWKNGDPAWRNGRGKGIIGALNYLASRGMNSVYMLTNNVGGDGMDVFPWTTYNTDFTRYDISKLEQWEIVFNHMDRLGLMCHFVTQETENQLLLDSGNMGLVRKLYYRELIARFSHHLAVMWNLGEENGPSEFLKKGQNDQQRRDMAEYFKKHDPYENVVVIHTHLSVEGKERILGSLLGFPYIDGIGLQTMPDEVHKQTLSWHNSSVHKGRKWNICSDEIGPSDTGAKPDNIDPDHSKIRQDVLWGNLMAGGAGVEWYFGYNFPNNDLNCEDWRSREKLWNQTRIAIDFFHNYVELKTLESADEKIITGNAYCLASDSLYIVYIKENAECSLRADKQKFYLSGWFNPLEGGAVIPGDTLLSDSTGLLHIIQPVLKRKIQDWAVVIRMLK
jgi:hypothetical protein